MQNHLTSVEVQAPRGKLDFIGIVEGSFLSTIHCYVNNEEEAQWKCDRFDHEEQLRFLRMVLEEYGIKETYIANYSKNIMTCFENGIECILK